MNIDKNVTKMVTNAPMKGKHHKLESIIKMSESKKGKNYGVIGNKHPFFGKPSWNKGKTGIDTEQSLKLMSIKAIERNKKYE